MGFKESIDRHSVRYFISGIAATTSMSVGIVMFLMNKKAELRDAKHELAIERVTQGYETTIRDNENEIADLKRRMSSVERTVGKSSNSLDVRQLLVSPRDAAKRLERSEYFPKDRFYGRRLLPGDKWLHEVTTELQLISRTTGISEVELRAAWPAHRVQALEAVPMHFWRSRRTFRIEGQPGLKDVTPFVLVQKMPHRQMSHLMELGIESSPGAEPTGDEASAQSTLGEGDESKPSIEALERLYCGDQTGLVLSSLLSMEVAAGSQGEATTRLKEIHKVGNVVYAHLETSLNDVVVNGKPQSEFLLIREMLLISTPSDLYVVKTLVPTPPDYSSDAIAWINGWFVDFGIRTAEGNMFNVFRAAGRQPDSRLE